MKLGSRVKWVKDLRMDLDIFGWQGLDMQALSGLSMNELKVTQITALGEEQERR